MILAQYFTIVVDVGLTQTYCAGRMQTTDGKFRSEIK